MKILDIIHRQQETLTISKQEVKGGDELKRKVLEQYSHVSEDEDRFVEDQYVSCLSCHFQETSI